MSYNLYARPKPKNVPEPTVFIHLKYAIRDYLLYHDGSLREGPYALGKETIPFLKGIQAAGHHDLKIEAGILTEMLEANPQGVYIWVGDGTEGDE